jgi:hypothetical protein
VRALKNRLVVPFAGIFLCVAVSGWFNDRHRRLRYSQYPQIGRSVQVHDRTLNIFCSGHGTPPVIFETSSHQAGFSWSAVQTHVAQFTEACWYDRAGYGWSDDGPLPRTFRATADDLHALLKASRLAGPYVLVGAYDATSIIRVYNGLYPTDVAGAVFIDGNDVNVYAHQVAVPERIKGPWDKSFGALAPYARGTFCSIFPVVVAITSQLPKTGQPRRTLAYGLPPDQQAQLDFLSDRAFGEACDVEQNVTDVREAGHLGSRPLIVLASSRQQTPQGHDPSGVDQWNDWWVTNAQQGLVALSTRARLARVPDRVDVKSIVSAVREVLKNTRSGT